MINDRERLESVKKKIIRLMIVLARSNGKDDFIKDLEWLLVKAEQGIEKNESGEWFGK